jgi:predicted NBD/HSP70 family sugar kinase
MEWIAARYRQGDEAVVRTVDSRLRYFAAALLDAVNALNPDLVILSGELFSPFADPVEKLTSMIREEVGGAGLVTNFRKAKMVFMDLGADTAATGICHLLIRNEWGSGPQQAGRP